jgi:signal transduction histidine kinase
VISIFARMTREQVEVRITNEGEGIPQDELSNIFERFYRLKGPQARLIRGTGLGLAICKGIVEAHGGRIWAESIEGQGVTIAFILPLPAAPPTMNLERLEE